MDAKKRSDANDGEDDDDVMRFGVLEGENDQRVLGPQMEILNVSDEEDEEKWGRTSLFAACRNNKSEVSCRYVHSYLGFRHKQAWYVY